MNSEQFIKSIIEINKAVFHLKTDNDNLFISDDIVELEFPNQMYEGLEEPTEILYENTNLLFSWSLGGSMTSTTSSIGCIDNGKETLYLHFIDDLMYVLAYSSVIKKNKPHHEFLNLLLKSNGETFNTQLLSYELPEELLIGQGRIKQLFEKLFIDLIIGESLWHKIPPKIIDENAPDVIPKKIHPKHVIENEYITPSPDDFNQKELLEISKRFVKQLTYT